MATYKAPFLTVKHTPNLYSSHHYIMGTIFKGGARVVFDGSD